MGTRKFTILHNNDMHGDFLAESKGEKGELIGGLALLSGYINKVRKEEENVLYLIAGDMVQGSLIDSEYKGISTMEIINYLSPDVVALGNHEFDYGLPQLLLLEKMANFPIVNANLYIKKYHRRLMRPFHIIKKAGFDILFTGIITEKIMDTLKMDNLIGSIVSLEEASSEVGKICNAYKKDDIDLTILLTHIGLESDIALAKMLDPLWGVDMIIGGHSHSVLEKPECINNVLIAQSGSGTNQIGRFDIIVDDDKNSIVESKWQLIEINDSLVKPDLLLLDYINNYKKKVDNKYGSIICRFSKKLTHPKREIETSLGNLMADIFADNCECDVMFVGSGSIRVKELGPQLTLGDAIACFPYDDSLHRFSVNGQQLKEIFTHIMRIENRDGEGECYQINQGIEAVYSELEKKLISLRVAGHTVDDAKTYRIAMQGYHYNNAATYLGLDLKFMQTLSDHKVISTSAQQVFIEYLNSHQNIESKLEGRLKFL
jgi:5'-nucleotidase / UDP-sugar diphosphatase